MNLKELSPSELIRLAVADMKATIASGIKINMSTYGHYIDNPNICAVCFAGAVMLQHEKEVCSSRGDGELHPHLSENKNVYYALNAIRAGQINTFCDYLKIEMPEKVKQLKGYYDGCVPVNYIAGRESRFYSKMEEIAKCFE